jgi:ATP adenylyltransferase
MIDALWNGWRAAYLAGEGRNLAPGPHGVNQGSVFTQMLDSGLPDEQTNIVHRGRHTFAILNAFPYNPGHLLVLPYDEIPDLEQLEPATAVELWATVTDAVRVLKSVYAPGGVNVGVNLGRAAGGSVSEHLHVHVLPRWHGDANFLTSVASATTIPEALPVTAQKIRAAWASLD